MPTLTQPAIGSTAWGTQMNTNLQVLQTQLTNAMQGRMVLSTVTQILLKQYTGDTVEVNGLNVSMGASGLALNTTDHLIDNTGADTGSGMTIQQGNNTNVYYVYLSNASATTFASSLRASSSAPATLNGVLYLSASGNGANWRFIGYVRTIANGANPNFVDSLTQRYVVNYYNRRVTPIYSNPGYVDDNAYTQYTINVGNFVEANGGTGSKIEFISNGEDGIHYGAYGAAQGNSAAWALAVGVDTTTDPESCAVNTIATGAIDALSLDRCHLFSTAGYHYLDLLMASSVVAVSVYADAIRKGAAHDPDYTAIYAEIMA